MYFEYILYLKFSLKLDISDKIIEYFCAIIKNRIRGIYSKIFVSLDDLNSRIDENKLLQINYDSLVKHLLSVVCQSQNNTNNSQILPILSVPKNSILMTTHPWTWNLTWYVWYILIRIGKFPVRLWKYPLKYFSGPR